MSEKKGFFTSLFGGKKSGGCCSMEIVEEESGCCCIGGGCGTDSEPDLGGCDVSYGHLCNEENKR